MSPINKDIQIVLYIIIFLFAIHHTELRLVYLQFTPIATFVRSYPNKMDVLTRSTGQKVLYRVCRLRFFLTNKFEHVPQILILYIIYRILISSNRILPVGYYTLHRRDVALFSKTHSLCTISVASLSRSKKQVFHLVRRFHFVSIYSLL